MKTAQSPTPPTQAYLTHSSKKEVSSKPTHGDITIDNQCHCLNIRPPKQPTTQQRLPSFDTMLDAIINFNWACGTHDMLDQVVGENYSACEAGRHTNIMETLQSRMSQLSKVMVGWSNDSITPEAMRRDDIEVFDPTPDPSDDYITETTQMVVKNKADVALEIIDTIKGDIDVDLSELMTLSKALNGANYSASDPIEKRLQTVDTMIDLISKVKRAAKKIFRQLNPNLKGQPKTYGFYDDTRPNEGDINQAMNVLFHARRILLNEKMAHSINTLTGHTTPPLTIREGIQRQSYYYLSRNDAATLLNTVSRRDIHNSNLSSDKKRLLFSLRHHFTLEIKREDFKQVADKKICIIPCERDAVIELVTKMADHLEH